MKNLTGQVFGRLTVLGISHRHRGPDNLPVIYWQCRCSCGVEKAVQGRHLKAGATVSCGCIRKEILQAQRGEKNRSWRGGKTKTGHGYVVINTIWLPDGTVRRRVPEHHVVMEEIIGRELLEGETVHHKNGIRDDNRPENLELWASHHRYGQRVSDLVAYAEELLRRYAPEKLK